MRVVADGGKAFPGAHEGFLRQVAPCFVVAHQPRQVGADLAVVLLDQVAKGQPITGARQSHDLRQFRVDHGSSRRVTGGFALCGFKHPRSSSLVFLRSLLL